MARATFGRKTAFPSRAEVLKRQRAREAAREMRRWKARPAGGP
jgi:hypothetical protein